MLYPLSYEARGTRQRVVEKVVENLLTWVGSVGGQLPARLGQPVHVDRGPRCKKPPAGKLWPKRRWRAAILLGGRREIVAALVTEQRQRVHEQRQRVHEQRWQAKAIAINARLRGVHVTTPAVGLLRRRREHVGTRRDHRRGSADQH